MTSQAPRSIKAIIGANVRTARKAAGLTQSELGRLLGVENMAVSRWERAEVRPSDSNLQALSALFDRELGWFFVDREARERAA